eukprot:s3932_g3.t1
MTRHLMLKGCKVAAALPCLAMPAKGNAACGGPQPKRPDMGPYRDYPRLSPRQPSNLVGVYKEFISSPRIDNQLSTWGAIQGICEFASDDSAVAAAKDVAIAVSFDHEEVGSSSWTGADGATLPVWLERTMTALQVPDAAKPEMLTRSFLISADCAHGLHPNYAAKHQAMCEHTPWPGMFNRNKLEFDPQNVLC